MENEQVVANVTENDDDHGAKGEEQEENRLAEPSLEYHGHIKFSELCRKLEYIWNRKKNSSILHPFRKQEMLDILIPPTLFELEEARRNSGEPPESIFAMLRLLYPEKDGSRSFGMRESRLAEAYMDAFGYTPDFTEFQMLKNPSNRQIVGDQEPSIAGDFSLVVQKVLTGINGETRMDTTPSNLTLKDINQALDELAAIDKQGRDGTSQGGRSSKKIQKAEWLKQFTHGPKRIPPLEHKWLVRIIMGRLEFGIFFEVLLKHYHYLGNKIFDGFRSLRGTCQRLCYIPRLTHDEEVANSKDLAATAATDANMEHVLAEVAQRSDDSVQAKKRGPLPPSWQYEATKHLKSEDLRTMDCGNQPLRPYNQEQKSEDASKVVLYPDVFGGDFGDVESSLPIGKDLAINGGRWSLVSEESRLGVITSAIPLARVRGAYVTSHLHVGVTHVLCDLEESNPLVEYEPDLTDESVFRDTSAGRRILARLRYLESRRTENHKIYLVSPDWLRKDVWGSERISAADS